MDPATSPYVLPFPVGETHETGLANCSSSYHSAGQPDQYAFDFDMPLGTPFTAARGGTVVLVVEDAPKSGGSAGNYLIIDHHDGTYGLYHHSPNNGIEVEEDDEVEQGDVLGVTGRSGLAGYPHLHFMPSVVVLDPISNLAAAGSLHGSTAILIRLMDYLRKKNITGVFVNLVHGGNSAEATDVGISSMVDTWLLARDVELAGERNRVLYVLKARGIAHSNQLREFLITSKGIRLHPAYLGHGTVLTGSARRSQEARELADASQLDGELERQRLAFSHRQAQVESEIARLRAGLAAEEQDLNRSITVRTGPLNQSDADREAMDRSRATSKAITPES
jgi:hypothetical protein